MVIRKIDVTSAEDHVANVLEAVCGMKPFKIGRMRRKSGGQQVVDCEGFTKDSGSTPNRWKNENLFEHM